MASNDSSTNNNNFAVVDMEKIDNLEIAFKGVWAYLGVTLSMNWFTDYNINIAATIIATIVACIFGYWKIKEKKLNVKLAELVLEEKKDEKLNNQKITQMAIEAARRELKEQQQSEKKAGKDNE